MTERLKVQETDIGEFVRDKRHFEEQVAVVKRQRDENAMEPVEEYQPQFSSSVLSMQSSSPSHFHPFKMQSERSHSHNSGGHVAGALVVMLQDTSSAPSVQSASPSHFHLLGTQ